MWKKRALCLLLVVLCGAFLAACQQETTYPTQARTGTDASQAQTASEPVTVGQDLYSEPAAAVNYDDGSYDPASEEGGGAEILTVAQNAMTAPPIIDSEYAGATPVRIDPIDKPTPTPLPKLTFSYTTYEATALHLKFDGPTGWMVDDSQPDSYTLTYPDPSMDVAPTVLIRVSPLSKNYSKAELTKELKGNLDTISTEFDSFDPSNTATRSFIDGNGVYAAYKGTRKDGVGVAGRIIVNCVDKNLYVLHVSYPRAMADTFAEGVYNKVRHTMTLVAAKNS